MVDYTKRPKPSSAPASSGGPISLTKRGQTVSLAKSAATGGSGPIRVNLNWEQRPPAPEGKGFMKKLRGNVLSALKEELIAEQTNVDVWMCGRYLWRVR